MRMNCMKVLSGWRDRAHAHFCLRLPWRKRRRRKGGVSLLEALIAMTIMVVSVTGILRAFSASLVTGADAEKFAHAVLVLQMLDSQLRMGEFYPLETNTGTTSDESYEWNVTFQSTDLTDLYRVDLTVTWRRGQSRRSITVSTYHYQETSTL